MNKNLRRIPAFLNCLLALGSLIFCLITFSLFAGLWVGPLLYLFLSVTISLSEPQEGIKGVVQQVLLYLSLVMTIAFIIYATRPMEGWF